MGPQHPATHGVLRVELEIDGETVVKARPVVGYLHTGIEKTMESKLYYKAIPCTDRMDYLSPMSNNLGYCLAVEKMMGISLRNFRTNVSNSGGRSLARPPIRKNVVIIRCPPHAS